MTSRTNVCMMEGCTKRLVLMQRRSRFSATPNRSLPSSETLKIRLLVMRMAKFRSLTSVGIIVIPYLCKLPIVPLRKSQRVKKWALMSTILNKRGCLGQVIASESVPFEVGTLFFSHQSKVNSSLIGHVY